MSDPNPDIKFRFALFDVPSRILLKLALLTAPVALRAQESTPPPQQQQQPAPRVIVTGSSVPRIDREAPSPVVVITADDLRRSGRTSVQDVLRDLSANGQGALSQSFPGSSAGGAAGVSLRGLGVGATLVLIDGHRTAPFPIGDDTQREFVDIANLPFEAIDRIEILKNSGSAVYGSDAIAGVVNIVLKRSLEGHTLTVEAGSPQHGGGALRRAVLTVGAGDLAADGRNGWISAEIRRQDRISFADRGPMFTQTDYRSQGGDNTTLGALSAATGSHPPSGTGYVTDASGNIIGFMPGCSAAKLAADQCTYRDTWHEILPKTQVANLTGRYSQRLSGDWQASVLAALSDSKSEQVLQPAQTYASGYQGLAFGPGRAPVLLAPLPATTIPSTNPSFPSGTDQPSGYLRYTFLDLGPRVTEGNSLATRLVADMQGRAGPWDLSAAVGTSRVRLHQTQLNYVDPAHLQAALDSSSDPYLVGGPNTASVLSFISPRYQSRDRSSLSFAELGATRDVAELRGGPMSVSLGADYVHRSVNAAAPLESQSGEINLGSYYSIGQQNILSVHAETVAPVTHRLELQLAARYDRVAQSDGHVSPQAGFKFAATSGLALVGTASRGFRAPGIPESGNAALASVAGRSSDPVLCPDGNPTTVGNFPSQCAVQLVAVQSANRDLRPETSRSYSLGLIFEPAKDVGGRLDFWSLDVRDQIVTGSTLQSVRGDNLTPIDQVEPDGSTALAAPPVPPIAYQRFEYVNANATRVRGVDLELHAVGQMAGIGRWRSGLSLSHLQRYDMTIDGNTYRLAGTHGPSISGDTGNPRTRMQWNNALSTDAWTIAAAINYTSSYGATDPSAIAMFGSAETSCLDALHYSGGQAGAAFASALADGNIPSASMCRVRSFTTVDIDARLALSRQTELHVSVQNLFDRSAPYDWATYGGAGAPFNPALHQSGAIGRFLSVGFTVRF